MRISLYLSAYYGGRLIKDIEHEHRKRQKRVFMPESDSIKERGAGCEDDQYMHIVMVTVK